jgi:hypothetical protein
LIDSEADGLPIGPVRQYWAAEVLAAKDDEIRSHEGWALRTGESSFRNVIAQFDRGG